MKKLINMLFAGKSINTSKGKLTFDKDGACVLEDEVADAFKDVKGFIIENNDNDHDEENSDKTVNAAENSSNATGGIEGDFEDKTDTESITGGVDLDSLSVPSLKKYAKDNGIDIAGLTTKEPILKVIKGAIQK